MRAHGGGIVAYSEEGEGTTFALYFPVGLAHMPVTTATGTVAPGQGELVLLVDDEAALAQIGRRLLERVGYASLTFTTPATALAALAGDEGAIRVVVTDLDMAGMNGLELARQVQQLRPGLPVIVTTGYTGRLPAGTIGRDGIVGVLQKPYTSAALAGALGNALGRALLPA
jgi:DNA-binding NtrC family response regulator